MKREEQVNTGRTMKITALIVVIVFSLGFAVTPVLAGDAPGPAPSPDRDYSGDDKVFDALIMRPMGLVATVFGTGVFIVSLPFTLISGDADKAGEKLVSDPLRYTFKRPLGDI